MIQSMLNYDEAWTKVLQEVLINYKLLSDNHWSKIKF